MLILVIFFFSSFNIHVKLAFVLTLTIECNILMQFEFLGILCIYVVRNLGRFIYSKWGR